MSFIHWKLVHRLNDLPIFNVKWLLGSLQADISAGDQVILAFVLEFSAENGDFS